MPHCANQEMSLGEQGLPNEIFTSLFVHHPSHFMFTPANPPFNPALYGTNFAWVQNFIHRLAPQGMAVPLCGIAHDSAVLGSSNQSGERDFESTSWMKTGSFPQRATP